jgi:hypothetical protein
MAGKAGKGAGREKGLEERSETRHNKPLISVYYTFLLKSDNRGVTIMWHGLPSRSIPEIQLFPMLAELGVEDKLQYFYMPVQNNKRIGNLGLRGKGYVFIHFFDQDTLRYFLRKVEEGLEVGEKKTSTTLALHQGISANLEQILASPRIATMSGDVYIRTNEELHRISIQSLYQTHCSLTGQS